MKYQDGKLPVQSEVLRDIEDQRRVIKSKKNAFLNFKNPSWDYKDSLKHQIQQRMRIVPEQVTAPGSCMNPLVGLLDKNGFSVNSGKDIANSCKRIESKTLNRVDYLSKKRR